MLDKILKKFSKGDKDTKFLFKKSLLAFTVRGGGMLAQYVLIFFIAKFYGPKEQGSYTLAITILQLFAIFSQMGLDNRLIRITAANSSLSDHSIIKTTYLQSLRLTFLSSVVWASIIWLSAPWIAGTFFSKPQLTEHIRIICLAFVPFVFIGLNSAGFRGFKNMTGFLAFKGLLPLIAALFLFGFYFFKTDFGAVNAYAIGALLVCVASFVGWFRFSKIKDFSFQPKLSTVEILKESMPMMLTGSIFFILGWTDNLILGIFRSVEEVGMYDMAFKLSTLSAVVLIAVNAIQAPTFAELYSKGEMKRLQGFIFSSTKLLFYTSFPVTIVLCLFPQEILGIFGSGFKTASTALIILAIGNFVNSITGSIGILLQMSGKQKEYNRIIMIAAIGSVLLNFILVPKIGIMGAAISSTLAKVFQNIASVIYARRNMGILSLYLPGIEKIIKFKQTTTQNISPTTAGEDPTKHEH
jgi:O-antigen/teichoic acid export membrane protein